MLPLTVFVFALMALHARTSSALPMLGSADPFIDNNELDPNAGVDHHRPRSSGGGAATPLARRHWIKVTKAPPAVVRRQPGEATVLECEVSARPAPRVEWLRNNVPIVQVDEYSNNFLPQGSMQGFVVAQSRLIINSLLPNDKSTYTCLGKSGEKTAFFSTTVVTGGNFMKPHNITEFILMNKQMMNAPTKPTIVYNYGSMLELMGTVAILPCKAVGNPQPEIFWTNSDGELVGNQDPRVKVLPSDELMIDGLSFSDMGDYTCIAKNSVGEDYSATFVYPLMPEK